MLYAEPGWSPLPKIASYVTAQGLTLIQVQDNLEALYGESKNSQKWNLWETSDKIRTKDKLTWHGWWVSAINRPPTCMWEEGWYLYAKEVNGGQCLWPCCNPNPVHIEALVTRDAR